LGQFRGFKKDARMMIIAGLVHFLGFALNGFILILYLKELGYSTVVFGTLSLIMEVANVAVLLGSGFMADRYGRKVMLVISAVLSTLGIAIFALSDGMMMFSLASALLGASGGFWGPAFNALLTVKTRVKRRKYLFSLNAIIGHMGSGMITLVGGFIPLFFMTYFNFTSEPAYRMIYLLALFLNFAGIIILLRLKPEKEWERRTEIASCDEKKPWWLLFKFALPAGFTGIGAGMLVPYFPYYFQLRFDLDLSTIGIFFALLSFVMVLMTVYLPRLAERQGTVLTTTGFHLVALIAMISIPFTPWLSVVVFLFVVRAALMNVPGPIMTSFMMCRIPSHARATANSSVQFAWMMPHAIGVFIGGFLWATGDLVLPFLIAFVFYVISVLLYAALFYKMDDKKHKDLPNFPALQRK